MIDISAIDYSKFDRPEILMMLFHPRPEWPLSGGAKESEDILIPVERDVVVGGRFHLSGKSNANILFFHGNGEIVADYDDLGSPYVRRGMNFLPVDYRGYGRSTGIPTITNMMRDAHVIFHHVLRWLSESGHEGPLIVIKSPSSTSKFIPCRTSISSFPDKKLFLTSLRAVITLLISYSLHRIKSGSFLCRI